MKTTRRLIVQYILTVVLLLSVFFSSCTAGVDPDSSGTNNSSTRILVFSATKGYRHGSISEGVSALRKLGGKNGFSIDASEDADVFTAENLKKYRVVIFLNTTGSFFNGSQKQVFQEFVTQGGGFVGIHSATDTFYDWPWYGKMIGGYFKSHPEIQNATLQVVNKNHPATAQLPSSWKKRDEWYNFKALSNDINVLITIDESSYKGGENGKIHPVSWYHHVAKGRVFYTALGHTKESYSDEVFLKHLLGGLKWAMNGGAY